MKMLIMIISLNFMAFAQITSGKAVMKLNQDINFSSGVITGNPGSMVTLYSPPSCTTKTKNIDFSIIVINGGLCMCPCPASGPGSQKPFYVFNKIWDSLHIKTPLNINDSSQFKKIDTVKYVGGEPCSLPYTYAGSYTPSGNTIIVKTQSNKFVLIHAKSGTKAQDSCYEDVLSYVLDYTINWYLQNNGSLDFSSVDLTGIGPGFNGNSGNSGANIKDPSLKQFKIGFTNDFSARNAKTFYSINGERINRASFSKINSLIIYK